MHPPTHPPTPPLPDSVPNKSGHFLRLLYHREEADPLAATLKSVGNISQSSSAFRSFCGIVIDGVVIVVEKRLRFSSAFGDN